MNKKIQLLKEITLKINEFLKEVEKYFISFDKIIIYYDNGQNELASTLDNILKYNRKVERRIQFDHVKKRLFQVSDMLTFIDKLNYKYNNNMDFTKAEKYFFQMKKSNT